MTKKGNHAGALFALPLFYLLLTGKFGALLGKNFTPYKHLQVQSYLQQHYQPYYQYSAPKEDIDNANLTNQASSPTFHKTRMEPLSVALCNYYTDYESCLTKPNIRSNAINEANNYNNGNLSQEDYNTYKIPYNNFYAPSIIKETS